jgi:hypothetical protein
MQAVANLSIQVGHDSIIWNSIPSEIHKASTISENSANLRHHNELNGCSFLEERDAVSSLSSNDSTHIWGKKESSSNLNRSKASGKEMEEVCNVCNGLKVEVNSPATLSVVWSCVKIFVWPQTTFLTDWSIQTMNLDSTDNVLGKVLQTTKKTNLTKIGRIKFWNKYGTVVQKELNDIKAARTRSIKDEVRRGMF